MSTSETFDEESSSPSSEGKEISDYELEVEEFESLSDGTSHVHVSSASDKNVADSSALVPCDDEPIADKECVQNYVEKEKLHINAMQ
jgi:hypothetical protein